MICTGVLVGILPEKKHFSQIVGTEKYYRWRDKSSDRLRIYSTVSSPWLTPCFFVVRVTLSRSRGSLGGEENFYPSYCDLIVQGQATGQVVNSRIVRERHKGYFSHTLKTPLFFAAFPTGEEINWLAISVYSA